MKKVVSTAIVRPARRFKGLKTSRASVSPTKRFHRRPQKSARSDIFQGSRKTSSERRPAARKPPIAARKAPSRRSTNDAARAHDGTGSAAESHPA